MPEIPGLTSGLRRVGGHLTKEAASVGASSSGGTKCTAMAAVSLLRHYFLDIRILVNVVDLMALQPQSEHPYGLEDFDELFTTERPVIFAFHGYSSVIHKLTYRRHNQDNIHVRGYCDEGITTTPFGIVVLNNLDRFQLALDAIRRIPPLSDQSRRRRRGTGPTWNATSSTLASMATTCRRSATGAGRPERDACPLTYCLGVGCAGFEQRLVLAQVRPLPCRADESRLAADR